MRGVILVSVGIATLLSTTAMAQAVPPPTPVDNTTAADSGLSDIVVTAQRRSERLQDVPIAVSVVTPQALIDNNIHSLQDLGATVPGFVATKSAGYGAAPLSIRGIGGANGGGNFFADEPVATYIDGVYIGRLSVATSDIVDLDGIQILRGPQGTLYGRNSTAGAVLIATRRPTNDLEGQAQASIDTIGNQRLEAAVGGPIVSDVLQARIAGAIADHEGWGRNVVTGLRTNNGRDITVRGSLRYLPTSSITVDLIGEHTDQHFAPGLFRVATVTGGPADSPYVRRPDFNQAIQNNQYAFNENNFNTLVTNAATLAAEFRGRAVTLNLISAYRTFDVDGLADSDNTAPADLTGGPLRSFNSARLRNTQFTQEVRLSSPQGDRRFNWTVGGFYIHEDNAVAPFVIQTSTAYFGDPNGTTLGTNMLSQAEIRAKLVKVIKDLVSLGLLLKLDPHEPEADSSDVLRSRYGLHRTFATFLRDRHGAPINDAKLATAFNMSLFMSDPSDTTAAEPGFHDELGNLVDRLAGAWHDLARNGNGDGSGAPVGGAVAVAAGLTSHQLLVDRDLSYVGGSAAENALRVLYLHDDERPAAIDSVGPRALRETSACFRAAFSIVRSYYSTGVLLKLGTGDGAVSIDRDRALTEHAQRLDRLITSFGKITAARDLARATLCDGSKEQIDLMGPEPLYADDLVWLHNERAVVALAQGHLFEAREALSHASRINAQTVESDYRGHNWRRIAVNFVSTRIERGSLKSAERYLDQIEQSVEESPWPGPLGDLTRVDAIRARFDRDNLSPPIRGTEHFAREEMTIIA